MEIMPRELSVDHKRMIAMMQTEPYYSMPFHRAWVEVGIAVRGVRALRFWQT